MRCRVCNSEMIIFDTIKECRTEHTMIKDIPYDIPLCEVSLYKCPSCSHLQIENLLKEDYYNDFVLMDNSRMTYYGLQQNVGLERLKKLQLMNNGVSIVDIGCGRGDILECANNFFDRCVGIEPSYNECKRARDKGLLVVNAYVDENYKTEEKFDAFICNMVFEHLDNPVGTLSKIGEMLKPHGVGLINIPDGATIVAQGFYHQFLLAHINYYGILSICTLARNCGFEVVDVQRDIDLLELNVYVRKTTDEKVISKKMEEHKEKLSGFLEGCENIICWGAGMKANKYSCLLKDIDIKAIVDSDDNKVGKYVSGISIPISRVDKKQVIESDAIIITASTYSKEIISRLKQMGYAGKVIYFRHEDNTIHMIKL